MVLILGDKKIFLRDSLFWDVATIDVENNKKLIMERVFTRGNKEEFFGLMGFYPKKEIRKNITKISSLDKKVIHFFSNYYSIPKEKFACYTKKPFRVKHWN